MVTRYLTFVLPAILFAGCSAHQATTEPAGPAVDPAAEERAIRDRFEKAYFKISCMANEGVDPLMTITPLRKPEDYVEGLIERKDPEIEAVNRVLESHGFADFEAFRVLEKRLRADRKYWRTIDDRFVDELLKCE